MNFAQKVKEEILKKPTKESCCKKAFLLGIVRGSGRLFMKDDEFGLDLKVEGEKTSMLTTELFRQVFNYEIREVSYSQDNRHDREVVTLSIFGENTRQILIELGIDIEEGEELSVSFKSIKELCEKDCCLRSYFKGLFLSSGSCVLPSKINSENTHYHLEMVFSHPKSASETMEKLEKAGINSRIIRRKNNYVVYIKSGEEIKNFLAFIGCPVAVLSLTDLMIMREMTNNINRQKNCDLGNLNRQVEAAGKQLDAIRKIEKVKGLNWLKPALFEIATERINNPDETLSELAERLNLSKSCINHRLRNIVALASKI